MKIFAFNLMFGLAWPLLVGSISVASVGLGLLIGYILLYLAKPIIGPTSYFRKTALTARFFFYFLGELIVANMRIAYEVISLRPRRRPGIVAVPLDAKTDVEITLLANLITLTPGSMTVDVSQDRRTLYVHAMFIHDVDSFRASIKSGFEKRVLELLR